MWKDLTACNHTKNAKIVYNTALWRSLPFIGMFSKEA
jgi:hypothetical protein